jgi:acetyl-CoA carboxylase carboxyltransferase component
MSAAVATPLDYGLPLARIDLLCDPGTFAPLRSAVGDGVVAGQGRVSGRPVFAWAQDGAVRGGSLGSAGGETIARTIDLADRAGAPVVGFLHSGGARLQEGTAALNAYAAIFRAQATARVPQVSVIAGACAGGAAYSPALGDLVVMAGPRARLFLPGPQVVEAVTREHVTAEELGGPKVHARSGVAHLVATDDVTAAEVVRDALAHLPSVAGGPLPLAAPAAPLSGDPSGPLPARQRQVYDVREVIRRIVDAGALLELAPRWARNLVVGFARIDGSPIGVVANQPHYLGGCLDAAAGEKGAWFVQLCDRYGLPLVVLSDTPGFLPGTAQERAAVIRHGAALLGAFARARVPRVTITLRQAYGGGHIVMNSRDLGATLTLAWPDARLGVMGARQAVGIVNRRELADGADADELADRYAAEHLPVSRAAEAGHVDEVIAPRHTRSRIAAVLEAWR